MLQERRGNVDRREGEKMPLAQSNAQRQTVLSPGGNSGNYSNHRQNGKVSHNTQTV
jgi:hypothetical protein